MCHKYHPQGTRKLRGSQSYKGTNNCMMTYKFRYFSKVFSSFREFCKTLPSGSTRGDNLQIPSQSCYISSGSALAENTNVFMLQTVNSAWSTRENKAIFSSGSALSYAQHNPRDLKLSPENWRQTNIALVRDCECIGQALRPIQGSSLLNILGFEWQDISSNNSNKLWRKLSENPWIGRWIPKVLQLAIGCLWRAHHLR